MYYLFYTYPDILCASLLVPGLCLILFGVAYCLSDSNVTLDKASGYECGFDPFSDARDPFNIKFYLVSILSIIFDVEIIFSFPWVLRQPYIITDDGFGFFTMFAFFLLLVIGSMYEYRKKALDRSE
jgi:NADH:ubiquinone oxidoreductase subunit 3 (subunit A)